MGYRVALMPVHVGVDHASAKGAYARWPAANMESTIETESFLSSLIARWPSIAGRSSRLEGTIATDDEAPFQIDIDGGLIVLEVSWGALTRVMPDVHRLASFAGVLMYLPNDGPIIARDGPVLGEAFEHHGRLVRPEESIDLSGEWAARQEAEVRSNDQWVADAHLGTRWHTDADVP